MKPRSIHTILRTSLIIACFSQAASAADLYWDANGGTTGTGGTGTWNTTSTTTWRIGSETGGLQAFVSGDAAYFGGTAGAVTMGVATTTSGITVLSSASGNYSLSTLNGTTTNLLTLAADTPISVPSGKSLSITGPTSGAVLGGNVTTIIQGGGTMNISGSNRVFQGTFRATGSGTTLVVSGTNALDNGSASTGIDARAGSIIRVAGTNNYRRTAFLDGGTLECGNIRSLQAQTNNILTVNATSGTRSIVENAKTGEIGGIAGNGSTGRVVTVNSTGDSGGIDLEYRAGWRNGTLNKAGAGTMVITSASTFNRNDNYTTANNGSSALSVNAGTVVNEGTIMSPATVGGTGLLRNGATTGIFDQIDLNTGGTFEISRLSGLFNAGFSHAAGKSDFNFNGGTLRYATGFSEDLSPNFAAIPAAGGSVDTNGNNVTFASPLTGTGPLAKKGGGSLTLAGTHTLTNLNVEAGVLKLASDASISGMTVTLKATGQLDATGGATFNGAVLANEFGRSVDDVTGDLTLASGSILRPGGANNDFEMKFGGDLTLNGVFEVDLTNFSPGLDSINVAGDLDVTNGLFSINLATPSPTGGVIATYGGTLTGTPQLSGFIAGSRYAPTLVHNAGAKTIQLSISGSTAPLALEWNGSEGSAWDMTTTQKNFTQTATSTPDTFKQLDLVTFGNPAGSTNVVLTGELAPGSLSFNHSVDYTLSGSGSIAGITSLVKDGTGILNLHTDNTYSGGTTITAGQVNVGNGGTTGSLGSGAIVNNGILAFNRSANLTLGSAISGSGSVSFAGGAVYTLNETNTWSGGTSILGGMVKQGKAGAIPVPSGGSATVTVASGATLDLGGFAIAGTNAQPVVIAGPGISPTTGALANTGSGLFSTGINFLALAGDASIGNDGARFDLVGTAGAGGVTSTDPLIPRKLTKIGTNQISLKTDDYSGVSEVVIDGGTLGVESDNFGAPTRTVTVNALGTLSLWGGRNLSNPFVMNGGVLRSDNATTNIVAGDIQLAATSTFAGAGSTAFTASGVISGTGALIKDGASDLTLSNTNTYSGGTSLRGTGRLILTDAGALGTTGDIELAGGAASQLTLASSGMTLGRPVAVKSGGRVNEGTIYANQTGTTTMAGEVTVSGAHNAGGTFGAIAGGELVLSGKVIQSVIGLDPLQPTVATPVRISLRNGVVRFDNTANDFSWLYLSENTLKLGASNALPTTAIISLGDNGNASIFEMNGFSQEVRSLARWGNTGSTTIRNTGATASELTFNTDFTGRLQRETVLAIGVPTADGSVAVTVTAGDFGSPVLLDVPVLTGETTDVWAGKIRSALAADATISPVFDVTGTGNQITLVRKTGAANDGTLNIALANGASSPGITADATSENALPGVAPFYNGAITGDISLRKTGPETLTVSGAFTQTGTTTVQQGKLVFNATHTGGGTYTVNAGATLAGNGNTASATDVSGSIAPGDVNTLGALRTGSLTLNDGSTVAINLNSTDVASDYLRAEGSVTASGTVTLTANDANPNASLPPGSKVFVIGYTGSFTGTLVFDGNPVADDSVIQIGPNFYQVNYNDTGSDTASALTFTAVANPADAYLDWIKDYTSIPEALRGKSADADGDGVINLAEFALGTDPSSGSSSPNHPPFLTDGSGGAKHLSITTLVRSGAVFTGAPPAASIDGVNYTIQGSENLAAFTAGVESIANPGGLPPAPSGYEYKSFRLANPTTSPNRGFMRVMVEETPAP